MSKNKSLSILKASKEIKKKKKKKKNYQRYKKKNLMMKHFKTQETLLG